MAESTVEKRAFSLHSPYADRVSLVYAVAFAPFWGYTLWYFWGDLGKRFSLLLCLACLLWSLLRDYLSNRTHRLEMSDGELVEIAWLRSRFSLSLDAIKQVEIRKRPWYLGGYESVAVMGPGWRVLRIPRGCPERLAIVEALKQRLPASVFEPW